MSLGNVEVKVTLGPAEAKRNFMPSSWPTVQ